jgi:hypothetical protein
MKTARETSQSLQRAKVGLVGLAAVLLLIGFASVIMRAVNRERPVAAVGASQPDVVANMAIDNTVDASSEPLADLGVSASTTNTESPVPR